MRRTIYKICGLGFLLLIPVFASALVSQVKFTTEPQTVKPNEISGTLTIQLQDENGNSSPATETVDVEFLSSSPTGEFLSPNSENSVTKTISTGSANKNFRYRDPTVGIFTITVNLKGRVSGSPWSTTQMINVTDLISTSTASSTDSVSQEDDSELDTSNQPNTTLKQSSNVSSAHFSSAGLSSRKSASTLNISAGRDRLGSVGSPIEFRAEANFDYTRNGNFIWNFGDGTQEIGEVLTHTYEYPGEYVVILNADFPEGRGVARANVNIIDPQVTIIAANENKVEIKNNSNQEINLYGRGLWNGNQVFLFPKDSLIRPGQSISFSSHVTGLVPSNNSLISLIIVGQTEQPKLRNKIEEIKKAKITQIETELVSLRTQLAQMSFSLPKQNITTEISTEEINNKELVNSASTSVATVIKSGWWETIKKFFMKDN